ncbi:MAG: DUF4124 domain-containing protein [Deltaproteobacteria bacterium]|nr:DUF4124 domain-containing protein [Deltaproteobacteria bacterium]
MKSSSLKLLCILLPLVTILIPVCCFGEIYQWADDNGNLHFSQAPPPTSTVEEDYQVQGEIPRGPDNVSLPEIIEKTIFDNADSINFAKFPWRPEKLLPGHHMTKIPQNISDVTELDFSVEGNLIIFKYVCYYHKFNKYILTTDKLCLSDVIIDLPEHVQPYRVRFEKADKSGFVERTYRELGYKLKDGTYSSPPGGAAHVMSYLNSYAITFSLKEDAKDLLDKFLKLKQQIR